MPLVTIEVDGLFVDGLTPAATVAFGKWFAPSIAVRARFTGWELKGRFWLD